MYNRALVVLAGGSSRRFQSNEGQWQDKALMTYKERPLLVHLLNESKEFYNKFGVSVNSNKRRKTYSKIIKSENFDVTVEYIIDSKNNNFEGVLKGIQTSMRYFIDNEIQFVPSDRPYIIFEILDRMKVDPNGVSIFQHSDGMIEPLLALYGPKSRIPSLFQNLSLSRADVPIRLAESISSYNVNTLVERHEIPSDIFTNINVRVNFNDNKVKHELSSNFDLHSPRKIVKRQNTIANILEFDNTIPDIATSLIENQHYYASFLLTLSALNQKKIDSNLLKKLGKNALAMEREYWIENNIPFLELHVLQDLVSNFPEEQTKKNMSSMLKLKERMKIKPRRV